MNATANTATDSATHAARSPQRPPAHGRLLVALFGSACTLAACDDPTDSEALAVLAADEASEDAADGAEGFTFDPHLVAEGEPAEGFGVVKLAVPQSYCGQTPTTCGTPPSPDWCTTYTWLADSVGILPLYRGIMKDKCEKGWNGACYECWELQNHCLQANTFKTTAVCSGLWARCACMAVALGEPQVY